MTQTQPAAARPALSWPDLLTQLVSGQDLDAVQSGWAMQQVLSGEATAVQVAGFAVALRSKGETATEIQALSDAMLAAGQPLRVTGRCLDIVGTGGDRSMSVNISTMAAIVAAGAGAKVVKHGSRSASSASGSADVLEALGVRLDLSSERVAHLAEQNDITFAFAAAFHPAMRHAAAPRRELGIATSFNFLGPLSNPARPTAQAIGCADARMAPIMAQVFANRGVSAWVFRGDDGLDELTVSTTSTVWVAEDGSVRQLSVDPRDVGLDYSPIEALRGGEPSFNAQVVRDLLQGKTGAVRDAVLLNAGAALAVYEADQAGPLDQQQLTERLTAGISRAAQAIDTGAAERTLQRWVELSTAAGSQV